MEGRKFVCFALAIVLASGMAYAARVEVSGGCLVSPIPIDPGTKNEDMYWLEFQTNNGTATWNGITVQNRVVTGHTTAWTDVDSIEIWRDNGDYAFDHTSDTWIGGNTVSFDVSGGFAVITFSSGQLINTNWPPRFFIVYDISSTAPGWHYVGAYMPDSSYIVLAADTPSDTVWNYHFPHGNCDQPLPVVLTSFNAHPGNKAVTLRWRTESEMGSIRWIIERSLAKGGEYERIGYADAQGYVTYRTDYEFTDRNLKNDVTYWYKLTVECVDGTDSFGPVSATPGDRLSPSVSFQIYPNPFKGTTKIEYTLSENCHVSLNIYDYSGRIVRTLVDADESVGLHISTWDGKDSDGIEVTAGAYLCLMSSNGVSCTKKIMVLK
ncbi:T9SS type A sorting domain-containing protein [candidate division WOR-3 bacterium]|nr:T9SS type A sorting domain-containing protein [candidate division WOR-3 bacterium]